MSVKNHLTNDRRRSSVRIGIQLPIDYSISEEPWLYMSKAINISRGGLFIRTRDPLPIDTRLVLSIPVFTASDQFGQNRVTARAKVVHSWKAEGRNTLAPGRVGAKFLGIGEKDWRQVLRTMSRLLEEKAVATTGDKDDQFDYGSQHEEEPLSTIQAESVLVFDGLNLDEAEIKPHSIETASEFSQSFVPIEHVESNRRDRRIEVEMMAKLQTAGGELFIQVFDLSPKGMGFISNHLMSEGTDVTLSMGGHGIIPFCLEGKLVRRLPLVTTGRPQYCYGMLFREENLQYESFFSELL